jgi:ketosteroid isomerase-like protein
MPDQIEIAHRLREAMTAESFATNVRDEAALELFEESIGSLCHEDFETAMVSGGPGLRNEYRGMQGFVSAWRDWVTPFESFRITIDDDTLGTGDVLLGLAHQTGELAGGGEVSSDAAAVMFFRDGLLARVEFHMDRAEALRAAGLEAG